MMSTESTPAKNAAVAGTKWGAVLIAMGLPHYGLPVIAGAYVLSYLRARTNSA